MNKYQKIFYSKRFVLLSCLVTLIFIFILLYDKFVEEVSTAKLMDDVFLIILFSASTYIFWKGYKRQSKNDNNKYQQLNQE